MQSHDGSGIGRSTESVDSCWSLIRAFKAQELWPPVVPTTVLVECLCGDPRRDANTHRFLRMCIIEAAVSESTARRAAELRGRARTGSAVVAIAKRSGTVVTGDRADIQALATHANNVAVEIV